jgi:hypothetical protein
MPNESDSKLTSKDAAAASEPKKGAFQLSSEPVTGIEESPDEAHKFEIGAAPDVVSSGPLPDYEELGSLPSSYDEDTLFLVARDPRWLFAYWDFDPSRYPASGMRYGYPQFFLRVYRAGGETEGTVEINPHARNWYVPVHHPDADYTAEIGFLNQDGAWQPIVGSGPTHTPPDALAPGDAPVDFATVPAHLTFERLLALVQERMAEGETLMAALARVAGEGRIEFRAGQAPTWNEEQKRLLAALLGDSLIDRAGMGSAEIDQLLRKHLEERLHSESASLLSGGLIGMAAGELGPSTQSLFSAIGASWSAQPFSLKTERGFYMHVNAEIIFYGGTHPDATVTVNGQSIRLAPDGSFRYHFTLPDGDYNIPIVATSPDKVEQRSATLSFQRGTSRVGDVGSTSQPGELNSLIGRR